MEDAPLPIIQTPKEEIKESFGVKQEENNYKLNINIINQEIILNILDEKDFMKEYEIKLTFDELKNIHKIFLTFSSCKDFIDFIKATIENKKISIKKNKENQITIELIFEYIFKQNIIKFELEQKRINFELAIHDLYQKYSNLEMNYKKVIEENKNIKNKFKILEDENKNLINRINNLELKINSPNKNLISIKKNNKLFSIDSEIIEKNDELDMLYSAIKERMNKEIKEIKKLYQATKDGGEPEIFHKLCDDISNTLVLYKSAGNRRFGGFTSQCWKSKNHSLDDKNCFLFSLDRMKIYNSKDDNVGIDDYSNEGPNFIRNGYYIININKNALREKTLKTFETKHKNIFGEDEHALSEDGKFEGICAKEYEVLQIIFE